MICLECDERIGKGVTTCPNCGTEYGDLTTVIPPIPPIPVPTSVKQDEPKRRGRPRKEDSEPKAKSVITVSTTVTGTSSDRIIPWNRYNSSYYSIIAPARHPDGQGGWLPFCPAMPKKTEEGYTTNPEEVLEWVENVMLGGHERQCNYTLTAILYFAAKIWSNDRPDMEKSSDYDTVRNLLMATFLNNQ